MLAAGYSQGHRRLEIAGITAFLAVTTILSIKVLLNAGQNGWLIAAAVLMGFIAADFTSGFVHWAADSWGALDMPVLGASFLRPFREHHVDQKAITRHDFVETNGNNSLISLPMLGGALAVPLKDDEWFGSCLVAFITALALFVFATNQIHKWAHTDEPPRAVVLMQRAQLILPPAHHAIHHTAPYDKHYCITVGWLNGSLGYIRFFRGLEWTITRLTGALPRQDDIGRDAALAVAHKEGLFEPLQAPKLPESREPARVAVRKD